MGVESKIIGSNSATGVLMEANTHKHEDGDAGLVVHTIPHTRFNPLVRPFLNPTLGTAMNQVVTFSGVPEIIHNGGTSTEWNFASGGKVVVTAANDGDTATFSEEGATTVDLSNFTAFTGKVDLDTFDPATNSMSIQFDLAGVQQGLTLNLNDFIGTGNFSEQSFAIPLSTFDLTSELIDGFTIMMNRSGGVKPTVKFDDLQIEAAGTPLTFKVTTPTGTRFHITELRINLADALAGTITGLADGTENATMPGLAYDQILGVATLTNGVTFSRVQGGITRFSASLKQLSDFLGTGSNFASAPISDGTNTFVSLLVTFPEPVLLVGDDGDFMSFTVNDDLSGLLLFTAFARGAIEL